MLRCRHFLWTDWTAAAVAARQARCSGGFSGRRLHSAAQATILNSTLQRSCFTLQPSLPACHPSTHTFQQAAHVIGLTSSKACLKTMLYTVAMDETSVMVLKCTVLCVLCVHRNCCTPCAHVHCPLTASRLRSRSICRVFSRRLGLFAFATATPAAKDTHPPHVP